MAGTQDGDEADLAVTRGWAARFQALARPDAELEAAAATAARLGTVAGEAVRALPFEAEPSHFQRLHARLAGQGDER